MKQSLGTIAFLLTLLIQLPQAIKVIRTKHTKDLSMSTYLILVGASTSWVFYGLLIGDLAIWTSNLIGLILALTIIGYKLRYD